MGEESAVQDGQSVQDGQRWMRDPQEVIRETKTLLREMVPDLTGRMKRLDQWLAEEVASIQAEGDGAIPEVEWRDLLREGMGESTRERVHQRGCLIVRGLFDRARAAEWNRVIGDYIETNRYLEKVTSRAGLDRYFSGLAAGRPQIYGLYWSKPQIEARQDPAMTQLRTMLHRLWETRREDGTEEFDSDRDCLYADRLRRRQPGDSSFGLSPHCDGGSIERWCDPHFRDVYREVFFGDVEAYHPFRAEGRTITEEIPSPAVCSVFRSFQGWTALTPQGKGDGTLRVIPLAASMAWILMRALQADVADDDLCGAVAGRALAIDPTWHAPLLAGLVSLPRIEPGDTVWWHPDLIHAVEDLHQGTQESNVIYIGAAPWCPKNAAFLPRQAERFLAGRSAPDFAAEDFEVDFIGRAQEGDLTPLGRRQMGLLPW
jgi:hypothetical protein